MTVLIIAILTMAILAMALLTMATILAMGMLPLLTSVLLAYSGALGGGDGQIW